LELQVEQLAKRRARAVAQGRADRARTLSARIATLYDEWATASNASAADVEEFALRRRR
jgi:hypothetical protein